MVFVFRPNATTSGSNLIIRLGDQVSTTVGYDYYKCGQGDYHGLNTSNLSTDLSVSGYDDGSCAMVQSALSTKIYYLRDVVTADEFDTNVTSTLNKFCFILTNEECTTLTFDYLFPIMTVQSGVILENIQQKAGPLQGPVDSDDF